MNFLSRVTLGELLRRDFGSIGYFETTRTDTLWILYTSAGSIFRQLLSDKKANKLSGASYRAAIFPSNTYFECSDIALWLYLSLISPKNPFRKQFRCPLLQAAYIPNRL